MDELYENELYHHGIKGMRWGIRRTPEQLGVRPRYTTRQRIQRIGQKADDRVSRIRAKNRVDVKIARANKKADDKINAAKAKAEERLNKAKGLETKSTKDKTVSLNDLRNKRNDLRDKRLTKKSEKTTLTEKDIKKMSPEALQKYKERLDLENSVMDSKLSNIEKYSRLNPKKEGFMKRVVAKKLGEQLTDGATKALGTATQLYLEKALGIERNKDAKAMLAKNGDNKGSESESGSGSGSGSGSFSPKSTGSRATSAISKVFGGKSDSGSSSSRASVVEPTPTPPKNANNNRAKLFTSTYADVVLPKSTNGKALLPSNRQPVVNNFLSNQKTVALSNYAKYGGKTYWTGEAPTTKLPDRSGYVTINGRQYKTNRNGVVIPDSYIRHGFMINPDELYHHGVKGMHWGVRRYQNPDGSLTEKGKARQARNVSSNRKAYISEGSTLYRTAGRKQSDVSDGKLYVTATKDASDYFLTKFGQQNVYNKGHAFTHEYTANKKIVMPSKKVMEKIELGLLKDKAVQKELVDSLMKNGFDREAATKLAKPYSAGHEFINRLPSGFVGAYTGLLAGFVPGGVSMSVAPVAISTGAGFAVGMSQQSLQKKQKLDAIRSTYGNIDNKVMNTKLQKAMLDKGYNAMKDYNDRRAFGKQGKQAVIVFDSKNNVTLKESKQLTASIYAKAYARAYQKEHPNTKLDFNDLVKDGERLYRDTYDKGVINRARKEENNKILNDNLKENARKNPGTWSK